MGRALRLTASWLLALVACVLTVVAIGGNWAQRQLLDTGVWTSHSVAVLRDPAVERITATFLADELIAQQSTIDGIQDALPAALRGSTGTATAALHALAEQTALEALRKGQLDAVWAATARASHEQFVRWLDGQGARRTGTVVTLDLEPALVRLAQLAGVPEAAIAAAAAGSPAAARVSIVRAGEYEQTRADVHRLQRVATLAPILAALAALLSIGLAPSGRRRGAVARAGLAATVAGVVVLVAAPAIGRRLTDSLTAGGAERAVSDAIWATLHPPLTHLAWSVVIAGLAVAAGAAATRRRA